LNYDERITKVKNVILQNELPHVECREVTE